MKQILIFISLFFITACVLNAQSVTANQLNGRLQMTTVSNVSDSTWSITGYFTNSVGKYLPSNVAVNDKFFCQIGANTYVGRISVINSRSDVTKLMTFRVICNYPNPPNNIGAIIRITSNGYPVFVDGLPNALQAGIQNYLVTKLNSASIDVTVLGDTAAAIRADFPTTAIPSGNAGGDLTLTYPNPIIKNNIVNRANLTASLRDSLIRIRKDTSINVGSGTTNYSALASTFARYNRVKIRCFLPTASTANIVLPTSSDTLKHTEFKVSLYAQDSVSGQINVTGFGGFAIYFDGTNVVTQEPNISLFNRQTVTLNTLYHNSSYYWISEISKDWLNEAINGGGSGGITDLTGDVTATGPGSAVATIGAAKVTTTKIADANVTLAKMAPNSVNGSKVVDLSITGSDIAAATIDYTKIGNYTIRGINLDYLTLRAGDATNPLMRWTAGAVLTTPVNGTWEWDANKLNFTIGGARKRIPVFNEATPSGGQLLIGNGGYDFTVANLTPGYAQTVTNGSGSITINPDTTKVIPYIPSGEISNNTRDGYFRTQTSFGHQFYNNGFRIFNSSLATTSGSTQLYVSNGTNDVGHLLVVSSTGATSSQTYVNNGSNGKSTTLDYKGFVTQVYYSSVNPASQAVTNYQVNGQYGIERITDGTVTTVTLPEIVGNPSTNQVGVGFILQLTINSPTTVTITRAGSDTIEVHGAASAANTVTATTGTIYSKTYVATGSNTWTVY